MPEWMGAWMPEWMGAWMYQVPGLVHLVHCNAWGRHYRMHGGGILG